MFEHAVYSVISPEGCASILWRTAEKASEAATAMQVTAADLLRLGVIDGIVEEPIGGAHRDPIKAIKSLSVAINEELDQLSVQSPVQLRTGRQDKFLTMGRSEEHTSELQSLMRISYAVFCLKKKKKNK